MSQPRRKHGEARTPIGRHSSPMAEAFQSALEQEFATAAARGDVWVRTRAGDLHNKVGGYPGKDHRMPVCCRVMRSLMLPTDPVVSTPQKGAGANCSGHMDTGGRRRLRSSRRFPSLGLRRTQEHRPKYHPARWTAFLRRDVSRCGVTVTGLGNKRDRTIDAAVPETGSPGWRAKCIGILPWHGRYIGDGTQYGVRESLVKPQVIV